MIINKDYYKRICNICDIILTDVDTNTRRICISWLHVIRPHPIILDRYKNIFKFDSNEIIKPFFNYIFFRKSLNIIYNIILSIFKTKKNLYFGNNFQNHKEGIDYLFISHLLNANEIENDMDFYFQNSTRYLNNIGHDTVTLLFNHTNKNNNYFKTLKNGSSKKIILANNLSFFFEIYLYILLLFESYHLYKKANLYKHDNLFQGILFESSRECITNHTIDNLRKYYQFKSLIKKLKPKIIITTYEGHAWERLFYYAAKNCNKNILCCGYQHTSLFNLQHSALRKLDDNYNPDIILTAGKFSENIFKNSEIGKNIPVFILGSNRGRDNQKYINIVDNNTCIVLPEGFECECLILFRFVIECANFSNSINFILKMHPIMNIKMFIDKYPEFNYLPKNVRWSTDDIDIEFSKCKWVLYRGTTLIIKACYSNLIPIYYQYNKDEISLDFLDEVSEYKSTISNLDEFFKSILLEKKKYKKDIIITYCNDIYQNFNYNILHQLTFIIL